MKNDENYHAVDVSKAGRISLLFAKALAFLRSNKKVFSKCLAKNFLGPPLAKKMRNGDCQILEVLRFLLSTLRS